MYSHAKYWFFCRPVASALVGVVALGILALLPARETAARPAAEYGPPISGAVRVIDGDTIVVDGRHIRLEGIDAPEIGQRCGRRLFGTWACGAAAAEALVAAVKGRTVACESRGKDGYGRTLGICFADGQDVNAYMVREGFAWAFVKYSKSYVREEAEAKSARAGIWTGEAEPAWLFRQNRWARAEYAAPQGCAIKANISAHGRVYYMPWSPRYASVKIEEEKGERWFCNEADAIDAGWRSSVVQ